MDEKIIYLVLIFALSAAAVLSLAACSQTIVPGTAWASEETLLFDITKDGTKIGTLETKIEKLAAGDYAIGRIRPEKFKVTSTSGIRYTETAKDLEGSVIMESESLMNGFSPLASYKLVDFNGENYTSKTYVEGKYFYYSLNGSSYKKTKLSGKNALVDNELLYVFIRAYTELDAGYSTTFKAINPSDGSLETFSAASNKDSRLQYTIPSVDEGGTVAENLAVSAVPVVYRKTDAPVGSSITAYFTAYADGIYKFNGDIDEVINYSFHVPVRIEENDVTYTLTALEVK